jgi:uncharacterized protein (DUF885 family)
MEEEATEAIPDKPEETEGEETIDEKEFAFAMAPIVRLMREELDGDKLIRSRVKREMNLWLEKLCRKISKKINESEYTVVELDDFKTAIEPYEMIDDVEQERRRIVATLEKVKQDCDSLIRDVNRKFITPETIVMGSGMQSQSTATPEEAKPVADAVKAAAKPAAEAVKAAAAAVKAPEAPKMAPAAKAPEAPAATFKPKPKY